MTLKQAEDGRGQNIKYLPYDFSEQGVAMLSSVLKSPTAVEVNIQIMRAFVAMRHFLQNNAQVFSEVQYPVPDTLIESYNKNARPLFDNRP